MNNRRPITSSRFFAFAVLLLAVPAGAAHRADLQVSVYSSGFVVDTQRQVIYGDRARRVTVKSFGKGTAKGETLDAAIEIDRLDPGVQWNLDPRAKTYTEMRYEAPVGEAGRPSGDSSGGPPLLKISQITPQTSGPLGSATINGLPCQSYTIRIVAEFVQPQTGKVLATETLLEKLWVTEKASEIEKFRKAESSFQAALSAAHGPEKADFRWLLRAFNRHILGMNNNLDDFKSLQMTYQGARAGIKGVTVRQLMGWNWRPMDPAAPGADLGDDMSTFIASIAAGLGAPPDQAGKKALTDSEKPRWVTELEKDLGRTGPTAMFREEIRQAHTVMVQPDVFEIPNEYRKQ